MLNAVFILLARYVRASLAAIAKIDPQFVVGLGLSFYALHFALGYFYLNIGSSSDNDASSPSSQFQITVREFVRPGLLLGSIVTTFCGIVASMYQYLARYSSPEIARRRQEHYEERLRQRMLEQQAQTEAPGAVEIVARRLENTIRQDVIDAIEHRFKGEAQRSYQHADLLRLIKDARMRLVEEIASLERRGNVNLVIGSITTLLGLVVLAYFVMSAPTQLTSANVLGYYVPRVTVIAFIQVFAFFFLRLYRASLEGIKFFHNELTNLEILFAALVTGINRGNEKTLASILLSLAKTERNFILAKGQSTVELERSKLEMDSLTTVTDSLSKLTKELRGTVAKHATKNS